MIKFLIGFIIGVWFGVMALALLVAGRDDR